MNRLSFSIPLLLSFGCDGSAPSSPAEPSDEWQIVFEQLPGALISVAGTSEDDVWVAGADGGEGSTLLHYDGQVWDQKNTGLTGVDLWWIHLFDESSLMIGGSNGTILRTDGETFERMTTPGSATVFGVWGTNENDVWAVGGEVDVASIGFIWHYDGQAWSDRTADLPAFAQSGVFFKAWGRSANDVWFVGFEGLAVHWDGESFEQGDPDTTRRLLTVHGAPDGDPLFAAVGGFGGGVISEYDGHAWHDVTPSGAFPEVFGVYLTGGGRGYAVGWDGAVARRSNNGWRLEETGINTDKSLHSVWVDPSGGVWAAGGDILAPPLFDGMLIHKGQPVANDFE